MQKLLFVALLMLTSFCAYPQNKPTSFYFYNTLHHFMGTSGGIYSLKTNLNKDSPIDIKRDQIATIQTDADSLGLVMGDQVHYIHFERGMSYYYFISLPEEHSNFIVTKVSAQEFWFTVHIHKGTDNQDYFLRAKN